MKLKTALRGALVVEWGLIAATILASIALEGSLPAPLREYLRSQEEQELKGSGAVLLIGGVAFVLATFVSTVGLFFLQRWARWLYTATTFSGFLLLLVAGPDVDHAVGAALGHVATFVSGLIVGLIHFTPVLEPQAANP